MRIEYNRRRKKYELKLELTDKCISCGYNGEGDCPFLDEIRNQNILLRKEPYYKIDCKMYFYLVDAGLEHDFKGFYFGKSEDIGFDDKYRCE